MPIEKTRDRLAGEHQLPIPVELRECTPADAFALATVSAATFLEAFAGLVPGDALLAHCRKSHTPEAFLAFFDRPETRIWLAEVPPGAAPVGYSVITAPHFPAGLAREGDLELRRIYLFSRFHGGGAGQRMMEAAISGAQSHKARRLLLGVHPGNRRAIAFYRRNGFIQIGSRSFQVGASVFEDPVFCLDLEGAATT